MAAAMAVAFYCDKTIIDVDSDDWVIDELGFTNLFDKLLPIVSSKNFLAIKISTGYFVNVFFFFFMFLVVISD
jgi:hypothetical protein